MENSKIFKRLVIVMLSLVLVAVCSTSVFATDDDLFLSVNSTGNTATNNTTNNTSKTNNNVNTLAKTGLSDTNGIVALIVVVCGVSAIYSYKKVNDYKKL